MPEARRLPETGEPEGQTRGVLPGAGQGVPRGRTRAPLHEQVRTEVTGERIPLPESPFTTTATLRLSVLAASLASVYLLAGCALLQPTDPYRPVSSYAPPAADSEAARAASGPGRSTRRQTRRPSRPTPRSGTRAPRMPVRHRAETAARGRPDASGSSPGFGRRRWPRAGRPPGASGGQDPKLPKNLRNRDPRLRLTQGKRLLLLRESPLHHESPSFLNARILPDSSHSVWTRIREHVNASHPDPTLLPRKGRMAPCRRIRIHSRPDYPLGTPRNCLLLQDLGNA